MTYIEAVGWTGVAISSGLAVVAFAYALEATVTMIRRWCSRDHR